MKPYEKIHKHRWIALFFCLTGCQHRIHYSVTVQHSHVPPVTTLKIECETKLPVPIVVIERS